MPRIACFGALLLLVSGARAQNTPAPRTFSFQGFLRDGAGQPVTSPQGGIPVAFSLYTAPTGGAPVWSEAGNLPVVAGRFSVLLGNTVPFPPDLSFDRPYWVGVKLGGDAEMAPRLPLQAVPYALNGWALSGNAATNPAAQFLGTTDDTPLVLKANGRQALRLADAKNAGNARSINVVAGNEGNTIADGMIGSVIAGGGVLNADGTSTVNEIHGSFDVIGGGVGNFIDATYYATVAGGSGNIAQEMYSTIGGGQSNNTQGQWSTIGGGSGNYTSASMSTVAGGTGNQAQGAYAAVGGGADNMASGQYGTVAGGSKNQAAGTQAFVGSGLQNVAGDLASVASGQGNQALGLRSFIGAGNNNKTSTGYDAVIGGGQNNVATGGDSGVFSGYQNTAGASAAAVLGGKFNTASGENSAIGGGSQNTAIGNAAAVVGGEKDTAFGDHATAGGGYLNNAYGQYATIPGGYYNAATGVGSFAAGIRAVAGHDGSFVWADDHDADFASSAANQFCLRASGGIVVESYGSVAFYTSATTGEKYRYLSLLNSPQSPSASGLKAGGILCSDSFDYANPGKNDMVVKGRLSIGFPTLSSGYALSVNGSVWAQNGYSTSDARLKRDVQPLDDALEKVLALRGVSFAWNRAAAKDRNFPEGRQVGFLAQNVEEVLPEAVREDGEGYKAVSYQEVIPLLSESIRTLKQQNDELAARNAALEAKLDALAQAVAALQAGRAPAARR